MVTTLHALAFAFYLIAGGILVVSLAGGRRSVPVGGVAAAGAAVLVHAAALVAYTTGFGELPLVGLAPSLSTLGFLIGGLQLGTAGLRDARPLGLVLVPLVVVLLGVALLLGIAPAGEVLAFKGAWFALHVVLAFAGYAGLAVAFASGLLYLLQFRTLKGKRFGRIFRFFPSLDTLDNTGRHALTVGFAALSLSLVLGWAWTIRFLQSFTATDPKVVWGVFSWFVFVTALAARRGGAGSDRRSALVSVVGFVAVVVAFVALRLSVGSGDGFL